MENARPQSPEASALDTRILANSSEYIKTNDILATHYCRCFCGIPCVFCRTLDFSAGLAELRERQVA